METRLIAPINGTVTSRIVNAIADLNRVRIEGEAHEADANRVSIGAEVEIRADGFPGRSFRGHVEEIPGNVTVRDQAAGSAQTRQHRRPEGQRSFEVGRQGKAAAPSRGCVS